MTVRFHKPSPLTLHCSLAPPPDAEGDEFFCDADALVAGAGAGDAAALERFDAMLALDPGRFEDDEAGEEEEEEEMA